MASLAGDTDGHPLASGWRHEIGGAALADLAAGRLALAASPRRPYLVEVGLGADGVPGRVPDGT